MKLQKFYGIEAGTFYMLHRARDLLWENGFELNSHYNFGRLVSVMLNIPDKYIQIYNKAPCHIIIFFTRKWGIFRQKAFRGDFQILSELISIFRAVSVKYDVDETTLKLV